MLFAGGTSGGRDLDMGLPNLDYYTFVWRHTERRIYPGEKLLDQVWGTKVYVERPYAWCTIVAAYVKLMSPLGHDRLVQTGTRSRLSLFKVNYNGTGSLTKVPMDSDFKVTVYV